MRDSIAARPAAARRRAAGATAAEATAWARLRDVARAAAQWLRLGARESRRFEDALEQALGGRQISLPVERFEELLGEASAPANGAARDGQGAEDDPDRIH